MGIPEATYYIWRKKYANLGVTELRQLRQLQEENARQAGGERATPTAMSCPARQLFRLHALGKDYGIAASNSQTKRD